MTLNTKRSNVPQICSTVLRFVPLVPRNPKFHIPFLSMVSPFRATGHVETSALNDHQTHLNTLKGKPCSNITPKSQTLVHFAVRFQVIMTFLRQVRLIIPK